MLSSGTLQSDLKTAVLEADSKFDVLLDSLANEQYITELSNLRNALIDFLIIQVDKEKIRTPKDFGIAVTIVSSKYLLVMNMAIV